MAHFRPRRVPKNSQHQAQIGCRVLTLSSKQEQASLRRKRFGLIFISLGLIAATRAVPAATINFDDIDASAGDVILTGYQGYNWTNFSAYTYAPGFPGFNNGIVSSQNAAYSNGVGKISAATTFDFTGAAFGSGYYDDLSVTVQGLLGGIVYYSQTVTVNTEAVQLYSFSFAGIDTLTLTTTTTAGTTDPYSCGPVGCSYFTIDNAVLTSDATMPPGPPVTTITPEPPAWTLLALGLLAMLPLGRMRASRM